MPFTRRCLGLRILSGLLALGFLLAAGPGHAHSLQGHTHPGSVEQDQPLHDHGSHETSGHPGEAPYEGEAHEPAGHGNEGASSENPAPEHRCGGCLCPAGPAGCAPGLLPDRRIPALGHAGNAIHELGAGGALSPSPRFDIFHPPRP